MSQQDRHERQLAGGDSNISWDNEATSGLRLGRRRRGSAVRWQAEPPALHRARERLAVLLCSK
eukprot:939692-Rhodomonas_salina.4